jgi:flagellar biosynthetic protein FliO
MFQSNAIPVLGSVTNALVGSGLPDSSATWGSLVRLMGSLCIVLAVLFAGVWFLRYWQRMAARSGARPQLRVVESRSLGQRQAIYLVECGQQRFLIGGSAGGLNLLSALPAAPEASGEPAPVPASASGARPAPVPMNFANALLQAISRST